MLRIASSAPRTPSTPSNFPPVGWVSRCEPMAMGVSLLFLPGLSANMLPTLSTETLQPKASHCALNQSRTRLSSSETVSRLMPPFGVAPYLAVSMMASHRRCGLMVRLLLAVMEAAFRDDAGVRREDCQAFLANSRKKSTAHNRASRRQ